MSNKRSMRRSKRLKPRKNGIECKGIAGGSSCSSSEETLQDLPSETFQDLDTKTPPLDRHGFVKTHVLHKQVSSAHAPIDPREVIIKREAKWIEMIADWKEALKKIDKVKSRCQKGIPQAIRAHAWKRLIGADILKEKNMNLYEELTGQADKSDWAYVIRKDIPRTFRHHSMFYENNSRGQEDLFNVLLAYTKYDIETGYNQALAPIAAVLLMHMPPDESFWCLVSICHNYLPGYYGSAMEAVRLDCMTFNRLLDTHCPHVSAHLKTQEVETTLYLVEWLICMFSRSLPFDTTLRVWDMFFCQGYKVLFKVAVAIMKVLFRNEKDLQDLDDYKTSQILNNLPKECVEVDILVPEVLATDITYHELKKIQKKITEENPDMKISRFAGGYYTHTPE